MNEWKCDRDQLSARRRACVCVCVYYVYLLGEENRPNMVICYCCCYIFVVGNLNPLADQTECVFVDIVKYVCVRRSPSSSHDQRRCGTDDVIYDIKTLL